MVVLRRLKSMPNPLSMRERRAFSKSKTLMITMRRAYRDFFGAQIVSDEEIRNYSHGAIWEVDDNLISAWKHRNKHQYVLECLGRVELHLARHALDALWDKVSFLLESDNLEHKKQLGMAQSDIDEMERRILEYEETFFHRTGESEFL